MTIDNERKGKPSASYIEAMAACPARWNFARHFPDVSGPDAERGNAVHAWLDAMASGNEPPELPEGWLADAEALHLKAEAVARSWFGDDWWGATGCFSEERTWHPSGEWSGQLDRYYTCSDPSGRGGLILDFKCSWMDQPPAASALQLRAQAVLGAHEWGDERVTVGFVTLKGRVDLCTYEAHHLEAADVEVSRIIADAYSPSAPLVPGERQCKYCPARNACPAVGKEAASLAVQAKQSEQAPGELWTFDRLADILDRAPVVEKFIKEARAEAKARIEAAPEAWAGLGWKLKPGAERRSISDVVAVAERLKDLGAPLDAIHAACSIPVGKVEALARNATKAKGRDLKAVVDEVLAGAVKVTPSAPSLARVPVAIKEAAE